MESITALFPKLFFWQARRWSLLSVLLLGSTVSYADSNIVWKGLQDPDIKDALFDSYQGNHFEAITRLQAAQKLGRIKQQTDRTALVLGGIYLSYGFHSEAERLFKAFLDRDQPKDIRDQAWFYLGKTQYQRGRLRDALKAFSNVGDTLGVALKPEKAVLEGIILLKLGKFDAAIRALGDVSVLSGWNAYAEYNTAIAQYKNGQKDKGIKLLTKIGSNHSSNDEIQNLKDKANLILGYGYFNEGKYTDAKKFLNRMLLTGRSSNKALFVLGRVYSSEENHKQSLIPWLELSKRDPSDFAVQQALMGIPFALGKLEAYKQSLEYYEQAMRTFQTEIDTINVAAESIGGGKLLVGLIRAQNGELAGGGVYTVEKVLDSPEGRYLWPLITQYEFRDALYNYSQLRMSLGKLELWSASVGSYNSLSPQRKIFFRERITKLQSKVLLATNKLEYYMQTLAYDELNRRKEILVNYFNEARFSVAKIYDYAAKRWGDE